MKKRISDFIQYCTFQSSLINVVNCTIKNHSESKIKTFFLSDFLHIPLEKRMNNIRTLC